MIDQPTTLADLVSGANADRCQGCPPERVCAWACKQGFSVTDNAAIAGLGLPLDWIFDADVESVRQALCDCYN